MHHRLNRRDYFKKTAAAGAGLGLFSGSSRLIAGALPGDDEGDASAALHAAETYLSKYPEGIFKDLAGSVLAR